MADPTVWYLLIDSDKSPIGRGGALYVKADTIFSLKSVVKDLEQLQDIPASRPIVWQCKSSQILADMDLLEIQEIITANFSDTNAVFDVPAGKNLVDLGLASKEMLLMKVPCLSFLGSLVLLANFFFNTYISKK